MVKAVCGIEVWTEDEGAVTEQCTVSACVKCYDALVEDLIEDESLEDALNRGYVPVILED